MCCKECCTCDCHDTRKEDIPLNESLNEYLDSNQHPDSDSLLEFLTFFKNYHDPLINDPSWYNKDRLMDLFNNLRVTL